MLIAIAVRMACLPFRSLPSAPDAAGIMERLKGELDGRRCLTEQDRAYLRWAAERLHDSHAIRPGNESPVVLDLWEELKTLRVNPKFLREALLDFLDPRGSKGKKYVRTLSLLRRELGP